MEALIGLSMIHMALPAFVLVVCLAVYALFVEPNRLQLTMVLAKLPGLQPELDGLRIVHISDCHGRHRIGGKQLDTWVSRLRPDLVVVTGDLFDPMNTVESTDRLLAVLSRLSAQWPVFYVTGNHEHQFDRPCRGRGGFACNRFASLRELLAELRQRGITVLLDEHKVLLVESHGGAPFSIVGVRDPALGYARLRRALGEAAQELPRPLVLLAHSPDIIGPARTAGIDVVLAGHTHGGQVRLPLVGAVVTRTRVGRRFASGLHKVGDTLLFVSRGLGMTSLPIRFLCPPELAVVQLAQLARPGGETGCLTTKE